MNDDDFKLAVAIAVPIIIIMLVALNIIVGRIDTLVNIQYQTCVNSMHNVGDVCAK